MSSKPSFDAAPSWRAATAHAAVLPRAKTASLASLRRKPTGAITYIQPSGADLFPGKELVTAFLKKLRRA